MDGFAEYPASTYVPLDRGPRVGNFTSGDIAALMSKGKGTPYGVPFYSYIEEKKMERRLGRPLSEEVFARPLSWGQLCQYQVFRLLGEDYTPCSSTPLDHPTIDCWKGTPDATKKPDVVAEVKCPITLKSFCLIIDSWRSGGINEVRRKHRDGEKFYWQIVSNAILTGAKYGELITYAPYQSELETIREMAQNFDGERQSRFLWIASSFDDELPFLPETGYYKNLNVMQFDIPETDKVALQERVEEAAKHLVDINLLSVNA